MRGVQALVFELPGQRLQLSMNLFRVDETPPSAVIAELERLGVAIGDQEVVGLCPAVAATRSAAGRILEARMGAAVAREGASRSANASADEEQVALSRRLAREAEELGAIDESQEALLGGAERCVALDSVLRAAGMVDGELSQLALVAARGLRTAIRSETAAAFHARVGALDRKLSG
jgi:hypothetical protein